MKNLPFLLFLLFLILNSLSCHRELSTSPEDTLLPKTLLFIDSKPEGSKIFIDGRFMGQRTPDTITWLEKGSHLITLKQNLLKDTNSVIDIKDEFTSVFFDYTTNPTMRGNLYIDSNPQGVDIYLNDSILPEKTPYLIRGLFPAEYNIRLKKYNFWDSETKATVVSERTVTADVTLIDSSKWINYNVGNIGLPTNWYNTLDIQDGYIKWLGSAGSGLIRMISGSEFTVYNTGNSNIPGNNVTSVKCCSEGVWIGTNKGAAYLSNGSFTVYNSANAGISDSITCIYAEPGCKVWVGSMDKGLFYFDGSSWTNYNKDNTPMLGTNRINSIFVDNNNIKWIGTYDMGLLVFDGTNWVRVYNALPSPQVDAIEVAGNDLWVGTSFHTRMVWNGVIFKEVHYKGGLAHLSGNIWKKFYDAGTKVIALKTDANGTLWLSDFNIAFKKKTESGFTLFPYNKVNGIAIDGSGNKWLSTSERGILKYKGD